MKTLKEFFKFVLLLVVTGALFVFHLSLSDTKEQTNEEGFALLTEAFSSAYKAYSISSIKIAHEKTLKCAEELYQKELAEGKIQLEEGKSLLFSQGNNLIQIVPQGRFATGQLNVEGATPLHQQIILSADFFQRKIFRFLFPGSSKAHRAF